MSTEQRSILHGTSLSPGLAEGPVYLYKHLSGLTDLPVNIETKQIDEEYFNLDKATLKISHDLELLAAKVEEEIDSKLAEVFVAHQMIVNDSSLRKELRKEISFNLINASSAVKIVMLRWEQRFLLMESQIARDKGDDIHDLSIRLQNALAGITLHPLEEVPENCILATSRLMPSDTIFLAGRSCLAILLEHGSSASHAALFAREMALPCIAGIPDLLKSVKSASWALVDSDCGNVTFCPTEEDKVDFRKKVRIKENSLNRARLEARRPTLTKDGVKINVHANASCLTDSRQAVRNGADGIGLFRMEMLYMARTRAPDCQELFRQIKDIIKVFDDNPVCIRLLDIGADKQIPFMDFLVETNPALGQRGIRYLLRYPKLLETQLQALLLLSLEFDVSILIPMVTVADDALRVKDTLHKLAAELQVLKIPRLGAMIETPAAALQAVSISEHVDFMSFGTNDLTQYVFAADRENVMVDQYFDDTADAIFRLLKMTHEDLPHMPLSLCGELAGRPEQIARILQCGITSLSVATPLIPLIKGAVRKLSLSASHG